jgi:glycosyltransferase involved in cell wall biosynthesis
LGFKSTYLRILILNYEYPPLGGGAGIATRHLAERFALQGHKVHVVTAWFPGEPEFISEGNLSIMRLPSLRKRTYKSNPIEMLSWARQALRYFKQLPAEKMFDICLANFTLPGGPVAQYVCKKWNIPFVILSHGHDIPWFAPRQMFFWHLLCYGWIRKIMQNASKTILLTEDLKGTADRFAGKGLLEKNIIIPNGLLLEKYKTGFYHPDATLEILFVGRMVDQKDPVTFIKVCRILNKMKLPVRFTMIGDGPLKETVEKLALKWNINNIEILGQVSHYQVLKTYERSHLLLSPSREEAMSLVILEAVSRGLYTVTTKVGSNEKLIHPDINGEFVEYGNAEEMADKIAAFYFEKFTQGYEYPTAMLEFLHKEYSWDSVVEKYLQLFRSVLGLSRKENIAAR